MLTLKIIKLVVLLVVTSDVFGNDCSIELSIYQGQEIQYTHQYSRFICSMTCFNFEKYHLKWFHNDKIVQRGISSDDGVLFREFFPVFSNDTGQHTCLIYNDKNIIIGFKTVDLKVKDYVDSSYKNISKHVLPTNNNPFQFYWMPIMTSENLQPAIKDNHILELRCHFYSTNINFIKNVTADWYYYKPGLDIYDTFLGNRVKPLSYGNVNKPNIKTIPVMCESDNLLPVLIKNNYLFGRIKCFKSTLKILSPTLKSAGHYTCSPNVFSHMDLTLTSRYVTYSVNMAPKSLGDLEKFELFVKKTTNKAIVEIVCRVNVGNDLLQLFVHSISRLKYIKKKPKEITSIINLSKLSKSTLVICTSRYFGMKSLNLLPVNITNNQIPNNVNSLINKPNDNQYVISFSKPLYLGGITFILSMLLVSFVVMFCCRIHTQKKLEKMESIKKENLERMLNFNYWLINKDHYISNSNKLDSKYISNNDNIGCGSINNKAQSTLVDYDYNDNNTEYGQIIFVDNFSDVDNKAYDDAGDDFTPKNRKQCKSQQSIDHDDDVFTNDNQAATSVMLMEPRRTRKRTYSSNVYVTDSLIGQGEFGKVYRGSIVLKQQDSLYTSNFSSVSSNSMTHYINAPATSTSVNPDVTNDKDNINNYFNYKPLSKLSVAIKISQTQHGLEMLKNEANILSLVTSNDSSAENTTNNSNNHHIIQLIKIVKDPFMLIVELAPIGNLKDYLTNYNPLVNKDSKRLADGKLLLFCQQLSDAFDYLASLSIIHRDIAARNVLLVSENLIKLSDFGLSRHGSTYVDKSIKFCGPIRHMAPECFQKSFYSSSSDVWAFGITVWEIYNLGATPYNLCFDNLSVERAVCSGVINEHSDRTPNSIRLLMNRSWNMKTELRPHPSEIYEHLKNVYVSEYLEPFV